MIPKKFHIDKWLEKLEPHAKYFMLMFGMVLAVATVAGISDILNPTNRLVMWISLPIFFFAGLIVFASDLRRSSKQESTQKPMYIERAGRNRWISIGAVVFVAIVIGLIFVARQLPPTPQGYQAFFTAFAGIAALGTGIALGVFAYQQYKLRQTEHSLLFNPQISISSGAPIRGKAVYNNELYPYRIEWATSIYNSSNIPVLIKDMAVAVRIANRDSFKEEIYLNPIYCTILEPERLEPPFPVTLPAPQKIKWVIEGLGAGHEFEYLSENSNSQLFELIFRVRTSTPEEPSKPILLEHFSIPFVVPKNAPWGDKSPVLI